jgi:hypothetical protein
MYKIKTILFFALLFQVSFGFSQIKNTKPKKINCRADIELINMLIQSQFYEQASVVFKKIEKNKCQLSANDYFNAAFIYSSLNKNTLTLKYLEIAMQKKYDDTARMYEDKNLDKIRDLEKFKNLVGLIKQKIKADSINEIKENAIRLNNKAKSQFLKSSFSKIDLLKIEGVIPYVQNGKWGYMDKMGNGLTKPIFEFADFSSNNGLFFVYNTKRFFYTHKGQIDELSENKGELPIAAPIEEMPVDNYIERTNTPGFTLKDNKIVAYSSDYVQISLLNKDTVLYRGYKNYLQGKTWAIVKNKEEKIAIIDSVGNSLNKVYDFVYTMDEYTVLSRAYYKFNNKIFYVLKNLSGNKLLFELNGNAINTEKQVSDGGIFTFYKNRLGLKDFSIYSNKTNQMFKLYYSDLSQNLLVVKNANFELVFKKFYNEIIGYNGVCNDDSFTGYNFYYKEIENLFVLVKDGNDIFYVDMEGKEYKLKN